MDLTAKWKKLWNVSSGEAVMEILGSLWQVSPLEGDKHQVKVSTQKYQQWVQIRGLNHFHDSSNDQREAWMLWFVGFRKYCPFIFLPVRANKGTNAQRTPLSVPYLCAVFLSIHCPDEPEFGVELRSITRCRTGQHRPRYRPFAGLCRGVFNRWMERWGTMLNNQSSYNILGRSKIALYL